MSASVTLKYDPSNCFLGEQGIQPLDDLYPRLEGIRDEVAVEDVRLWDRQEIPEGKQPLDAAFFELPEKLLNERSEDGSELSQILKAADQLAEDVDRVVVLGIGGSYMGARALLEACRSPYYNELGRSQRGDRPRMYFEGNNVDNDATTDLLDLLKTKAGQGVDGKWAIVVISKSGGTMETAVALRQFLAALAEQEGSDPLGRLVLPVTGESGKLFELSNELGCQYRFRVPDGVGGRFSILSAVGLAPAAILGLDVVSLLEGAAAMNEHFRTAPADQNLVLKFVGVCHSAEQQRNATIRVLSVWSKALEAVGLWYDQLLAESLGKQGLGATPLTTVNTRDLHSRAQQHQEGARDKLITNLIVEHWKHAALPVGASDRNQDGLNDLADRTLPEIMSAAIAGTNQAYREGGRLTADLVLPKVDEFCLGQLLQMLMLATVVEGRLMAVNPYGQPGVEAYKRNMNQHLGRS